MSTWAAGEGILVLGDTSRMYVRQYVETMQEQLAGASLSIVTSDTSNSLPATSALNGYRCLVTVGNDAARKLAGQQISVPILHAMVTEALTRELYAEIQPSSTRSFLLVEQPVSRLLLLASQSMPERRRMGVLYGPSSILSQASVQRHAKRVGADLVEREVGNDNQLNDAVKYFNENADLLITLPDPVVVNEGSIKTLMLGAYHGNLPLLGYSHAMVKAGSLMSVHSTPKQLGLQSSELVVGAFWNVPTTKGAIIYPRYFQISVNYQVARALDIDLPDENELEARVKHAEMGR